MQRRLADQQDQGTSLLESHIPDPTSAVINLVLGDFFFVEAEDIEVVENRIALHMPRVGGVDARILPGQMVIVHGQRDLPAMVVMPPAYLLPPEAGSGVVALPYLLIETGLRAGELEKLVRVGDVVSFAQEPLELGSSALAGAAYGSALFYVISYVLTTLGAFGVVLLLARDGRVQRSYLGVGVVLLTAELVERKWHEAYRRFYLRPRRIARTLMRQETWLRLPRTARMAWRTVVGS